MKSALLAVSAALVFATGCAGISVQNYGSHPKYSMTEGATRADVFANLGEPDSIYQGADTEVMVYKAYKGRNYFGLYATLARTDKIVILDQQGTVIATRDIEVGKGRTYFVAPHALDMTHPVRTKELTESPENFDVEQ